MWCKNCKYDLRQLTEHRCPECGQAFDPNEPTPTYVEPTLGWHFILALSFGVPPVLTALGAAEQMVYHAKGAAMWASGRLMLIDVAGGVIMLVCIHHALLRTRYKTRLMWSGTPMLVIYILAMFFMSALIDWRPYRN